MKILACPKCGSNKVEMGTQNDGLWAGGIIPTSREFWRHVCKDCGFRGNFIEFDSEKDYGEFLSEFKKQEKNY